MISNMVSCIKIAAKLQKNTHISKYSLKNTLRMIEILCMNQLFNTLNDLFNAFYEISSTFAADLQNNTIQSFII